MQTAVIALLLVVAAGEAPAQSVRSSRSDTLLFDDDHEVLYRSDTRLVVHPAERYSAAAVISLTMPWEVAIGWKSVSRSPATGVYLLWCQAYAGERAADNRLECVVCYAESSDGVNFTKPELSQFPFKDAQRTNIVLIGNGGFGDRYWNCVLVNPAEEDPARRYRMAYRDWSKAEDGREDPGLYVAFSPDGIHWTKHPHGPLYRTSYGGRDLQPRYPDEDPLREFPAAGKPPRNMWLYLQTMSDAVDAVYDPQRSVYAIYGKMGWGSTLPMAAPGSTRWAVPKSRLSDLVEAPAAGDVR